MVSGFSLSSRLANPQHILAFGGPGMIQIPGAPCLRTWVLPASPEFWLRVIPVDSVESTYRWTIGNLHLLQRLLELELQSWTLNQTAWIRG